VTDQGSSPGRFAEFYRKNAAPMTPGEIKHYNEYPLRTIREYAARTGWSMYEAKVIVEQVFGCGHPAK